MILWELMRAVLPEHKDDDIKSRWRWLRETNRHNLRTLQADFQSYYLVAFENGELPLFDRDSPDAFPLMEHVEWFKKSIPFLGLVTFKSVSQFSFLMSLTPLLVTV